MRGPRIYSYLTLIGRISITEDGEGRVTGVYLPCMNLPPMEEEETPAIADAADQIEGYLSGAIRDFDVETLVEGTEFRRDVLSAISRIPYGETRTYSQIAEESGHPGASRAVGTVCAENPIPIIIPCHRVVPASGGLGAYSGGRALKRTLLAHEAESDDRLRLSHKGSRQSGQCSLRVQAYAG